MLKLLLHIYFHTLYISNHIPKTKHKFYNIPITNPNHITPATTTSTMVTIIILNNIPVTITFQYPYQTHITFPLPI